MNDSKEHFKDLSLEIQIDELETDELSISIKATDSQCRELASKFDLIKLESLFAEIEIVRSGAIYKVRGKFVAIVFHQCVVTLDPIQTQVHGEYACSYAERTSIAPNVVDIDLNFDDPPEALINGKIYIGNDLTQYFGLELNPFPRKIDANFSEMMHSEQKDSTKPNIRTPFSVLRKLKK